MGVVAVKYHLVSSFVVDSRCDTTILADYLDVPIYYFLKGCHLFRLQLISSLIVGLDYIQKLFELYPFVILLSSSSFECRAPTNLGFVGNVYYRAFLSVLLIFGPLFDEFQKSLLLFLRVFFGGFSLYKWFKINVDAWVYLIFELQVFQILFCATLGYF